MKEQIKKKKVVHENILLLNKRSRGESKSYSRWRL
jgi:hypothetical protein